MPLSIIGETERVQYAGQFLPLLPPMEEGRGEAATSAPNACVLFDINGITDLVNMHV